jgi:hypothetical protein
MADIAALTDSIDKLNAYLDDKIQSASQSMRSNAVKGASSPDTALTGKIQGSVSTSALDTLKQNPIINAGIDTINQYVTTAAQGFVRNTLDSITKKALTPIQNATQNFFTVFAQISVLTTEVWMELARNTARNIVSELKKRDEVSDKLNAEYTALYNACTILLNGQPFFNELLLKATTAYNLIAASRKNVANVADILEEKHVYRKQQFLTAQSQMEQARDLLLPPKGANIDSIRSLTTLADQTIKRRTNKDMLAAAAVIPQISVNIGRYIIEYSLLTISINARINTFVNALQDVIEGFQKNSFISDAQLAHLDSTIVQMNNILNDMGPFLNGGSAAAGSPTDVKYRAQLSAKTVKWGTEATAVVEWMKMNPGKGAEIIDKTGESVTRYTTATTKINAINTRTFTGGKVEIENGKENPVPLTTMTMPLLFSANLIVARQTTRKDIRVLTKNVQSYLATSRKVSAEIQAALLPFINTPKQIISPADKVVASLIQSANNLGLDRVVGLLSGGSIKEIFSLNPFNATHAGAAVVAITNVLKEVKGSGTATDEQVGQIEELKSQFEREKTTKEIEANRSSGATTDKDNEQLQANIDTLKRRVEEGKQAASQVSGDQAQDPMATINRDLSSVAPMLASDNKIPYMAEVRPSFLK